MHLLITGINVSINCSVGFDLVCALVFIAYGIVLTLQGCPAMISNGLCELATAPPELSLLKVLATIVVCMIV